MKYEFKKLLTRSMVLVLLVCAILNAFLFGRQQQSEHKDLLADYHYYLEQLEVLKADSDTVLPARLYLPARKQKHRFRRR